MQKVKMLANRPCNNFSRIPDYMTTISQRYRQMDGRTDNSWARTRGAQLSAGYTVNMYSKPPLYDASKCGNITRRSAVINAATAAENQRISKTRRWSIYSADRRTASQTCQSDSTQLKAGNLPWQYRALCSIARLFLAQFLLTIRK